MPYKSSLTQIDLFNINSSCCFIVFFYKSIIRSFPDVSVVCVVGAEYITINYYIGLLNIQ